MIIQDWSSYFNQLPKEFQDIYFTKKYHQLYVNNADSKSMGFIYEHGNDLFIFPFLLSNSYFPGTFDLESAYGYGGPISNSLDPDFYQSAWNLFFNEIQSFNVVAGFVRFHPLFNLKSEFLPENIRRIFDRKTVSIELNSTQGEDNSIDLLASFHSKHRNVIHKAQRNQLSVEILETLDLSVFCPIYFETMKRLQADSFYYFNETYFQKLKDTLSGFIFQGNVIEQGRCISSALFFASGNSAHYHLSGTKDESLHSGANTLLLYETAQFFKKKGYLNLHLGGGTTSSAEDSLFKFKHRFSKTLCDFSIGKIVFNQKLYEQACLEWSAKSDKEIVRKYSNFHLKYRY